MIHGTHENGSMMRSVIQHAQSMSWDWGTNGDPDDPDNPNKPPDPPDPNQLDLFPLFPDERNFEEKNQEQIIYGASFGMAY
jgi:hypothetical protein